VAARAFAAANPRIASADLAAARRLDQAMERYQASQPAPALRQRILGAAPRDRRVGRVWRWLAGAGLGLGLAASAAAGVAAGFTLGHPAVTRLMGPSALDLGEAPDPAGGAASG
jgi:hypothetical protein